MAPEICPNCGADVPPDAKACPECGSDEKTGWSEGAKADGLDLPDQEFDYEDFVKREFGKEGPVPRGVHWVWWVVGLILVCGIVLLFCFR
jgi:uncharacterized membrane protein YvbJ